METEKLIDKVEALKVPAKKVIKAKVKTEKELTLEKDLKIVKGQFKSEESRGSTIKFHFRKHKEVPVKQYSFTDGEIYEVPYMVARHLNTSGWYPVHQHLQDANGRVSTKVGQKVRRYSFVPLDFLDLEDHSAPSRIITVERV